MITNNPFSRLFRSSKFWLAVFGVVQTIVSHYANIPAEIWQSIDALVLAVIAGITAEDVALKLNKK